MNFNQEIEFYGEDIQDFEISPFEMIGAFHHRSKLHHYYDELTPEEQTLLNKYDQLLLKTSKKVYEHLKKIFDFQNDKPLEEWWWHLDKVLNNQISADLGQGTISHQSFLSTIVEFQSKEMYDLFLDWSRDKEIVVHRIYGKDQKII